jgi:hypothetical protein
MLLMIQSTIKRHPIASAAIFTGAVVALVLLAFVTPNYFFVLFRR